jgi:oligoribonuclease NrnB/cAMP/cGMP phosphodiesterase (DHH superfamily)
LFIDTVPSNLDEVLKVCNFVRVIDHHAIPNKSLLVGLELKYKNLHVIFADNKCGAEITWDYYCSGKEYPWFIQVIATHDCWRWDTAPKEHKALWRELFQGCTELDHWWFNYLLTWKEERIKIAVAKGKLLLQRDERNIELIASEAIETIYKTSNKNYQVLFVEKCDPSYISEVGNRLAQKEGCDFAALVSNFDEKTQTYSVSLRSIKEKVDVGKIAYDAKQEYKEQIIKGGGHPGAAGMQLKCSPYQLFQLKTIPVEFVPAVPIDLKEYKEV